MNADWVRFKEFVDNYYLNYFIISDSDRKVEIKTKLGTEDIYCGISKTQEDHASDLNDFETNYRANANKPIIEEIVSQFEKNDKDLKLACASANVDSITKEARCEILIPGTFGVAGAGRWIAGGYALVDTFEWDDRVCVHVEDCDRILAAYYGGLTDEQMQAQGDYPYYPMVKSYTDEEQPEANQGWHFWPLAQGNSLPPMGETEVEPLGGYGFIPAGFYLVTTLKRQITTGKFMMDIFWGKEGY